MARSSGRDRGQFTGVDGLRSTVIGRRSSVVGLRSTVRFGV
jgi:hypothetical protein